MNLQQSFLLLQGPASPFFKELGLELNNMGHLVWKVNFCGGDKITSIGGVPQFDYCSTFHDFPNWLSNLFKEYNFTHIILFGDTRPFHKMAITIAKQFHCKIYVYEEGYLRPDWITFEQSGVNGNSNVIISNEATNWLLNYKLKLTQHPHALDTALSTTKRFFQDLIYRLATMAYFVKYPHYKTYRPKNAFIEYLGWCKRIPLKILKKPYENKIIKSISLNKTNYYFFPLQLNSDAQIHTHSSFGTIENALNFVLHSFFKSAPKDSLLVIKNHPFDTGLINYKKIIIAFCKVHKTNAKKIIYLENGHLPTLLKNAQGTVVVNSTVGMSALVHHCPTIALGKAIYNMPGLTNQCSLDHFWNNLEKPNMELYIKLENFLIETNQINGNFYTKLGRKMGVKGSISLLNLTLYTPLIEYMNNLIINQPNYNV
jgi:capsular polysaccharide export protein